MTHPSRFAYPISRVILGIGASLTVVALSVVGLKATDDIPPMETAPQTVVLTKPPTTTVAPAPTTTTTTTTEAPKVPQTVPVWVDPDLPCQQWLPLALEIGWPADQRTITMLLRVMYRESRCTPEARSKSADTGLLQVNDYWCEPSRYTKHPVGWLGERMDLDSCAGLTDPAKNLHAGLLIWMYSQAKNGNGWHPWRYSGPTS